VVAAGVVEKPDDLAGIVDAFCKGAAVASGSSRVMKVPLLVRRKP